MDAGLKMPRSISVVVPVYNSELNLPVLIERLAPALDSLPNWYEVVLANNGSKGQHWKAMVKCSNALNWTRSAILMSNCKNTSIINEWWESWNF